MKLGVVAERKHGVPLAAGTDAASVGEVVLGPAVLAGIPATVYVSPDAPVLADRGTTATRCGTTWSWRVSG